MMAIINASLHYHKPVRCEQISNAAPKAALLLYLYMRIFFIVSLIFLISCKQESSRPDKIITGNWIVLYPEEELQTREQEKIYAKTQDSFTGLRCLKLLRFTKEGEFNQLDSVAVKGSWGMKENQLIQVEKGGRGFEPFHATFTSFDGEKMILSELAPVRGEKLRLNWHLLKLEKGESLKLFDDEMNKWRYKSAKPESDSAVRVRVEQMLKYYAIYFRLLAKESSYFIPGRLMLPVTLYQHGIGLKPFDEESKFASLFYSAEQAKFAWYVLDAAIDNSKTNFKTKGSFTEEYALWLDLFAEEVSKMNR